MLLKINDFRLVDLEIDLEKMAIKIAKKKNTRTTSTIFNNLF